MKLIPTTVTDSDGSRLTVRRTWPDDDGRLTLEAVDSTGRLRAGRLTPGHDAELVPYGEDPRLPGLAAAGGAGELLVHRFRKRAVVRATGAYLKVLPLGKAGGVAAAHVTAARLAEAAGIDVPRVLSVEAGTLTLSVVPGTSLHDLGRSRTDESHAAAERAWSSWAERWPGFAAPVPANDVALPSYRPEDEIRTLSLWVARCEAFDVLPVESATLRAAAGWAIDRLSAGTPQAPVLAHRDLHDKQVLVPEGTGSAGGVGLIDCDTLTLAEPALDLANLLVHLDFREAQGLLDPSIRAAGERAIRAVAGELLVPADRLAAYAESTRVRLACVYAFRPQWRELAGEWLRAGG